MKMYKCPFCGDEKEKDLKGANIHRCSSCGNLVRAIESSKKAEEKKAEEKPKAEEKSEEKKEAKPKRRRRKKKS